MRRLRLPLSLPDPILYRKIFYRGDEMQVKKVFLRLLIVILVVHLLITSPRQGEAAIIDGGTTAEGWGTFTDDVTGLTWLDLSALAGQNIGVMWDTINDHADWTVATYTEVDDLMEANPYTYFLDKAETFTYMGASS